MKIGFFTSVLEWGGSEMYLLRLMLGVRERGHKVVLFGVAGTRLWNEARAVGIESVAWRSIQAVDGGELRVEGGEWAVEGGESRVESGEWAVEGGEWTVEGGESRVGGGEWTVESEDENSHKEHRERKESGEWAVEGGDNDALSTHASPDATQGKAKNQEPDPISLPSTLHPLPSTLHSLLSKAKRILLRLTPDSFKLLAGNLREMLHLRRLFRAHPVDVMHVSNSGYEVAGIACRWLKMPSIVMNMITPSMDQAGIRGWLMRYTLRRYDHVSSQSAYCTGQWIKFAGISEENTSYVWNGVDLQRFKPKSEMRHLSEPFKLISLGRLSQMKGYDYLIKAMSLVSGCELTIYGEGEERENLERLIDSLNLQATVRLPGHIERPDLVLPEADCFVLPSVSYESCPAVLAQAMACGLPLITSDFGPLSEINKHEMTGLVLPMRDVLSLRDAIVRMSSDFLLRQQMRDSALSMVRVNLTEELMIKKCLCLYQRNYAGERARGRVCV